MCFQEKGEFAKLLCEDWQGDKCEEGDWQCAFHWNGELDYDDDDNDDNDLLKEFTELASSRKTSMALSTFSSGSQVAFDHHSIIFLFFLAAKLTSSKQHLRRDYDQCESTVFGASGRFDQTRVGQGPMGVPKVKITISVLRFIFCLLVFDSCFDQAPLEVFWHFGRGLLWAGWLVSINHSYCWRRGCTMHTAKFWRKSSFCKNWFIKQLGVEMWGSQYRWG